MSISEFIYAEIEKELERARRKSCKYRLPGVDEVIDFVNTNHNDPTTLTLGYTYWGTDGKTFASELKHDPAVETLCIEYIDRGVRDWVQFANTLSKHYPNLKTLVFKQMFGEFDGSEQDKTAHFQYFVNHLALDFLYIEDGGGTPYLRQYEYLGKSGPIIFEKKESIKRKL